MSRDLNYVPINYLQQLFRDKDTALPLAAGKVYFWKDQARTEPKEVFQLTGTPPNYTYITLGAELTLSSMGTFEDSSGNDITVYFHPTDANGETELYYVTVYNSGGIFQFSREGEPSVASEVQESVEDINYVPNGQFLTHNDAPSTDTTDEGEIVDAVTEVAPGGWTFERPSGSTAKDLVTFPRIGSPVSSPTGNPRYKIRVKCETPNVGDTFKGLRIKWRDVNKFTSQTGDVYTFSFYAQSNTASTNISVNVIKYYGSGGSLPITINKQDISIPSTGSTYNVAFNFGDNLDKTIGSNDDDYVQVEIAFPTSIAFDVSITNVALVSGDVTLAQYPNITNAQSLYRSLAGWLPVPDYDGADIGLPIILSSGGLSYDDSVIGMIYSTTLTDVPRGTLQCSGQNLNVSDYSSEGIPYRRLYDKWKDNTTGLSRFGTSKDFVTLTLPSTNTFKITNRSHGVVSASADGTPATGFTFVRTQTGTASLPEITDITTVAGSVLPAGSNFTFNVPTGTNTSFYIWYTVDGVGTDPEITSAKGILVAVLSTDTDDDIASKTVLAINSLTYYIPDWRGYFFRNWADSSAIDPDRATRTDRGDGTTGDNVGTVQADAFKIHSHSYDTTASNTNVSFGTQSAVFDTHVSTGTGNTGGNETRPKNIYLNYLVKY